MASERLCKLCRVNPAEVPDRYSGRPTLAVCRSCHAERLRGDLRALIAYKESPAPPPAAGGET